MSTVEGAPFPVGRGRGPVRRMLRRHWLAVAVLVITAVVAWALLAQSRQIDDLKGDKSSLSGGVTQLRDQVEGQGQTPVVGPPEQLVKEGVPGKDGAPGLQGDQGPRGREGAVGQQGATGVTAPCVTAPWVDPCVGPPGPAGQQGTQGQAGIPGGAGGIGGQGIAGPPGADGEAGPVGPVGPAGAAGTQGPQGPQGAQGEPGEPGRGPTDAELDAAVARYCGARNDCTGPPGPGLLGG